MNSNSLAPVLLILLIIISLPVLADGIALPPPTIHTYEFHAIQEKQQYAVIEVLSNYFERINMFLSLSSLDSKPRNVTLIIPLKSVPTEVDASKISSKEFLEKYEFKEIEKQAKKQSLTTFVKNSSSITVEYLKNYMLSSLFTPLYFVIPRRGYFVPIPMLEIGASKARAGYLPEGVKYIKKFEFEGGYMEIYKVESGASLEEFIKQYKGLEMPENLKKAIDNYKAYYIALLNLEIKPIEKYNLLKKYAPNTLKELIDYIKSNPNLTFKCVEHYYWYYDRPYYKCDERTIIKEKFSKFIEKANKEVGDKNANVAYKYIWVKVPSIPANSEKVIYMYLGNPSASSESNGDAVFDFFDDFEDGIWTDKWEQHSWHDCPGHVDWSGQKITESEGQLHSNGRNNDRTPLRSISEFPGTDLILESRYRYSWTDTCSGVGIGIFDASNNWVLCDNFPDRINNYAGRFGCSDGNYIRTSGIFGSFSNSINGDTTNDWRSYRIAIHGTTAELWYGSSLEDLTHHVSVNFNTPITSISRLKAEIWISEAGLDMEFFRVRKYASPEPSVKIGRRTLNRDNLLFNNWLYKIPITITENSGKTLKDYQIRIQVPKWLEKGIDSIRFYDPASGKKLNYYVETIIKPATRSEIETAIVDFVLSAYSNSTKGTEITIELPIKGEVYYPLGTGIAWQNPIEDTKILVRMDENLEVNFENKQKEILYNGKRYYLWSFKNWNPDYDIIGKINRKGFLTLFSDSKKKIVIAMNENITYFGIAFFVLAGVIAIFAVNIIEREYFKEKRKKWYKNLTLPTLFAIFSPLVSLWLTIFLPIILKTDFKKKELKSYARKIFILFAILFILYIILITIKILL